ncbi:unnamed protein product [Lactuca saligna]|uniref:Uncharacterized protein n=1 Tax=Lactuca saligna TaxID=75948 RepID=A0AA35VKC3_LACSI|nr:unnamed protein product [Lactuca saligna]
MPKGSKGNIIEYGECSVSAAPAMRRSKRSQLIAFAALPTYYDCGDCVCVCWFYGALFWYVERVRNHYETNCPKYNHCYKEGSVVFPLPPTPPSEIYNLYADIVFLNDIRGYNSMFSMTSFGVVVDKDIISGRAPYVFKVSGQVVHDLGRRDFDAGIVRVLMESLSNHNEYVRTFKTTKEMDKVMNMDSYAVRLYSNIPDRRDGSPTPDTLGCIVIGDDSNSVSYDIVVYSKSGCPQRVSKLHPSYMSLQYPLLFPFSKDDWSPRLKLQVIQVPVLEA